MPSLEYSVSIRPCLGESRSGDAAVLVDVNGGRLAAIVDGLGHGAPAHDVANRAVTFIRQAARADIASLMAELGSCLRGTIGAAVGLCYIDTSAGALSYVSVGNTVLRRFGSEDVRLMSQDGVVGVRMRTLRTQQTVLESGDVVLMHTDGVSDRFELSDYPQMLGHSADAIVRVVVRRFGKHHDDAACIALRFGR
jgi:serine phosphatase RsbU (regulator of sigma subunit)